MAVVAARSFPPDKAAPNLPSSVCFERHVTTRPIANCHVLFLDAGTWHPLNRNTAGALLLPCIRLLRKRRHPALTRAPCPRVGSIQDRFSLRQVRRIIACTHVKRYKALRTNME